MSKGKNIHMNEIYAITRPPQRPTSGDPPLLVLLHGFGSNEHDLMGLVPYLDSAFYIVSTRAIYDVGFGYAWYYLYGVPGNLQHDNASRARSLEALTAFIKDLPLHVKGDAKRIFLLGFSQGAVMSLNVALTAPHLVAGVVAISGYLDEQVAARVQVQSLDLSHLHILVMHGTLDDLIPVAGGRGIRNFLEKTNVNLEYYEYPIGHSIHPDALPVIQRWLTNRLNATAPSSSSDD